MVHKMSDYLIRKIKIFGCVAAAAILIAGCSKKAPTAPAPGSQAVPVLTAAVEQKNVPIEISGFGIVENYATVSLKTQVTGILNEVNFTEGQMVKKGDLLLQIDPRPFEAALKLAKANLDKDTVQLKNADKEANRQKELLAKGFASQNEYDNATTAAEALRAAVEADNAAVENAKLQLEYCTIYSPIDGIIGKLSVNKGNLVKLNDITVATIRQIVPIYVSFAFRQEYLPQIREYMSKGNLEVTAKGTTENSQEEKGVLSFVDNSVDLSTGTIFMRATFANEKQTLWPGQYVKLSAILTSDPNAIVIPSAAVQTSQTGQYVYVVKSDNTVEMRNITVKHIINNDSVVDGLNADETVVTDGQLRLVPGAKVQIKNQNGNKAKE
jgi:membrane fusion protein, multidrug efflux system